MNSTTILPQVIFELQGQQGYVVFMSDIVAWCRSWRECPDSGKVFWCVAYELKLDVFRIYREFAKAA